MRVGWVYCGALGEYGSLFDVWIEPPFRGQGLGRTLMNAMRSEGRKQGLQYLLLRTSEQRRGFCQKSGFQERLSSSTIRLKKGGQE
jgi:GNAT superfamily N-acetyltransferase